MYNTRKRMPNVVVALIGLVTAGTLVIPAPVAAQATTNTSNQRLRFNNAPVVVPPHGTFRVSGGVHVLLHSTLDASGGCHITGHANPQGLSVTGPTGTTFHGILNLNLIGKGQAPDLKLHINVKTRPETLPGCDASKVVELIVDQLGITLPPAPGS